jgi:hypothetical protein
VFSHTSEIFLGLRQQRIRERSEGRPKYILVRRLFPNFLRQSLLDLGSDPLLPLFVDLANPSDRKRDKCREIVHSPPAYVIKFGMKIKKSSPRLDFIWSKFHRQINAGAKSCLAPIFAAGKLVVVRQFDSGKTNLPVYHVSYLSDDDLWSQHPQTTGYQALNISKKFFLIDRGKVSKQLYPKKGVSLIFFFFFFFFN